MGASRRFTFSSSTWLARLEFGWTQLTSYTSPTVFITSLGLIVVFSKMKFKFGITKNIIKFFAPATLGVYIIHVNPVVWTNVMKSSMTTLSSGSVPMMVVKVLLVAFIMYVGLSLLDVVRIKLFDLIRIKKLYEMIDVTFDKLFEKRNKPENSTGK